MNKTESIITYPSSDYLILLLLDDIVACFNFYNTRSYNILNAIICLKSRALDTLRGILSEI